MLSKLWIYFSDLFPKKVNIKKRTKINLAFFGEGHFVFKEYLHFKSA
jgi:hypothetical protein